MSGEFQDDIEVDENAPEPPEFLDEVAVRKWYEKYEQMKRAGVWRQEFNDTLIMLCSLWTELVQIEQEIRDRKALIEGQRGGEKTDPLKKQKRRYWKQYKTVLASMGLTPNARNQLPTEGLESGTSEDEEIPEIKKALNKTD